MTKRALALMLALLWGGAASADFLEVETGARPMGMGGAFVGVADDVTALHWNPAGLARLGGFQLFGMRTSVYSVDGLSEDAVLAAYGAGRQGFGVGWLRTGAEHIYELYNEDTIVAGYGAETPVEGLAAGAAIKRYSIDAPGYAYYNDPAFKEGGDASFAVDLGCLYDGGKWKLGATVRNLGEPELKLIETTSDPDPIMSELRLGGSYVFREVMLMSAELRMPRDVPEYYEQRNTLNLGTEIWFYDAFALRAGLNRDRITAGLGLKTKPIRVDVALLSERRIGSLYRLSAIFTWGPKPAPDAPAVRGEPPHSPGLSNTVRWSDQSATGAVAYLVECSASSDFDPLLAKSGWIERTEYEFSGLADGETYYYRARARSGYGGVSDWSNAVQSIQDASPSETRAVCDESQHAFEAGAPLEFDVAFEASDSGSGVHYVELYCRAAGDGGYERFGDRFDESPIAFRVAAPGEYELFTLGVDEAGNRELPPEAPDCSVRVTVEPTGITFDRRL